MIIIYIISYHYRYKVANDIVFLLFYKYDVNISYHLLFVLLENETW